jgi:hypothetical protein
MEKRQVYEFNHKALFRRVSCLVLLLGGSLLALGVVYAIVVNGFIRGYDAVDVLSKLSKPQPLIGLSAVYVVAILGIKLISLAMVAFRVTLSDTEVSGRSGMGRRRTLPLEDLKEIRCFGTNGLCGCHLLSKSHGYIFIPLDLDNVEQLLAALEPYLPAEPSDK